MVARLYNELNASPQAKRFIVHGGSLPPIDELIEATDSVTAAVFVAPITDTCKEVVDGLVRRTVPRDTVAVTEGPWVFRRNALETALANVANREHDLKSLLALCQLAQLHVRALTHP